MASTPYKPVTFGNVAKIQDLQQISDNVQYVYENMPTIYYNFAGTIKKSSSLKMIAGLVNIVTPARAAWGFGVLFGNYFSEGCQPIVTANIVTEVSSKIHLNIYGFGVKRLPDRTGFVANCIADNTSAKVNVFPPGFSVSYIAVGY